MLQSTEGSQGPGFCQTLSMRRGERGRREGRGKSVRLQHSIPNAAHRPSPQPQDWSTLRLLGPSLSTGPLPAVSSPSVCPSLTPLSNIRDGIRAVCGPGCHCRQVLHFSPPKICLRIGTCIPTAITTQVTLCTPAQTYALSMPRSMLDNATSIVWLLVHLLPGFFPECAFDCVSVSFNGILRSKLPEDAAERWV